MWQFYREQYDQRVFSCCRVSVNICTIRNCIPSHLPIRKTFFFLVVFGAGMVLYPVELFSWRGCFVDSFLDVHFQKESQHFPISKRIARVNCVMMRVKLSTSNCRTCDPLCVCMLYTLAHAINRVPCAFGAVWFLVVIFEES